MMRAPRQKATGQMATERNVNIELMEGSVCFSYVPFVAELISSFTAHGQRLLKLLMCSHVWQARHGIEAFNCRCTAMERLLSNSL